MNCPDETDFAAARRRMVREQLAEFPARIRAAMQAVPRHLFMPEDQWERAYADGAVPIGLGQTISQPWIVARMTAQLDPQPASRILEIGAGSGYQAAVLAQLAAEVFTVEIIEPLARRAGEIFQQLGLNNVHLRVGDGFGGWPEAAPFDGVIVTCAPEETPAPLIAQVKEGGRLVIPVGPPGEQQLLLLQKRAGKCSNARGCPCASCP